MNYLAGNITALATVVCFTPGVMLVFGAQPKMNWASHQPLELHPPAPAVRRAAVRRQSESRLGPSPDEWSVPHSWHPKSMKAQNEPASLRTRRVLAGTTLHNTK